MSEMKVPVGISNRHVHLTQEDLEKLFGVGYKLTEKKKLSQPGQFAADECVTLVGPKRSIEKVRMIELILKPRIIDVTKEIKPPTIPTRIRTFNSLCWRSYFSSKK